MHPRFRKPSSAEASNKNSENQAPTSTAVLEMPATAADGYPDLKKLTVWQYMQQLTADQWINHTWYLWRTDPAGEFQKGQPRFREKGSFCIDEAWVDQKYGGYKWKIQLNRYDQRGNAISLYEFRFGTESRPKVQPGERLLEPEQTIPVAPAAQTAAPAQNNDRLYDMLERLIDRLEKSKEPPRATAGEVSTEKAMSNGLDIQAKAMTSGMEILKGIVESATGNKADPLEQIEKVASVLHKLNPTPAAAPQQDPIGQFTAMFDFVEKIRGKTDDGKSGGSNGKYAIVEAISSGVAQIINTPVGQQLGAFLLTKLMTAGAAASPAQPNAPAGPHLILRAAAAPGAEPANAASVLSPNPNPNAQETGVVTVEQYRASKLQLIKETMVRMFSEGTDGSQIAAWIDQADPEFADKLCSVMEQAAANPAVLEPWKQDPTLKKLFDFPLLRLIEFGEQFVAYFEEEEGPKKPEAPEKTSPDSPPAA